MLRGEQVLTLGGMLDLELAVHEGGGESLECRLAFNLDLFDASTAQRMLGHLMARPRLPISRLGQVALSLASCAASSHSM